MAQEEGTFDRDSTLASTEGTGRRKFCFFSVLEANVLWHQSSRLRDQFVFSLSGLPLELSQLLGLTFRGKRHGSLLGVVGLMVP